MASTLQYLTVQDVLWINLEATRVRNGFKYATLEEATFYQYAYGESNSLIPQAARFVSGFLKLSPFAAGNRVTSFIATMAFLRSNGEVVKLSDREATAWFDAIAKTRKEALAGLQSILSPIEVDPDFEGGEEPSEHAGGTPGMRGAIESVLKDFPITVSDLAARG